MFWFWEALFGKPVTLPDPPPDFVTIKGPSREQLQSDLIDCRKHAGELQHKVTLHEATIADLKAKLAAAELHVERCDLGVIAAEKERDEAKGCFETEREVSKTYHRGMIEARKERDEANAQTDRLLDVLNEYAKNLNIVGKRLDEQMQAAGFDRKPKDPKPTETPDAVQS